VKIELGARSDHFPVERTSVEPYLSDPFPDALDNPSARVRVLGVERTFWEKATILHMLHHWPVEKKIAPRMSRHYYDVFQMSHSYAIDRAMDEIDLLSRVATHKSVFFRSSWARYDRAIPGTLRLVPCEHHVRPLEQDYDAMQPMFFGSAPGFDEILRRLPELEGKINAVEG
jgi:hypothetical protein